MVEEVPLRNVYDLIDLMKRRPAMYIGENKISAMNSFLDGYYFCAATHNIQEEKVFSAVSKTKNRPKKVSNACLENRKTHGRFRR